MHVVTLGIESCEVSGAKLETLVRCGTRDNLDTHPGTPEVPLAPP